MKNHRIKHRLSSTSNVVYIPEIVDSLSIINLFFPCLKEYSICVLKKAYFLQIESRDLLSLLELTSHLDMQPSSDLLFSQ